MIECVHAAVVPPVDSGLQQLVRDELITNILAATGEEVASVELDSNGKWSLGNESIPIDAGEDSDGEANAKRA